jgi:hypothetical protein
MPVLPEGKAEGRDPPDGSDDPIRFDAKAAWSCTMLAP